MSPNGANNLTEHNDEKTADPSLEFRRINRHKQIITTKRK